MLPGVPYLYFEQETLYTCSVELYKMISSYYGSPRKESEVSDKLTELFAAHPHMPRRVKRIASLSA